MANLDTAHTHNPLYLQHHACNTLNIRHLCTMSPASNCISLWCTTNITTKISRTTDTFVLLAIYHRQCYWEICKSHLHSSSHGSLHPVLIFPAAVVLISDSHTANSILMTQQLPTPLITHKFIQIQQNNQFQARRGQPACSGWKWLRTSSVHSHSLD